MFASIPSDTPQNHYSHSINYETDGLVNGTFTVTAQHGFVAGQYTTPIFCDITKDGNKEMITYTANTITITSVTASGFEDSATLTLIPYTATDDTINWVACADFGGDESLSGSSHILAVHQGDTDNESEIQYIEYNPSYTTQNSGIVAISGTQFYSVGYLDALPSSSATVSCARTPLSVEGVGGKTLCAYNNADTVVVFSRTINSINTLFPIADGDDCVNNIVCQAYTVNGSYTLATATTGNNLVTGGTVGLTIDTSFHKHVFFQDTQSQTIKKITLTPLSTSVSDTASTRTIQSGRFVTSDITNNGQLDVCRYGRNTDDHPTHKASITCLTTNGGTQLVSYQSVFNSGQGFVNAVTFYDMDGDGDKEVLFNTYHSTEQAQRTFQILGFTAPNTIASVSNLANTFPNTRTLSIARSHTDDALVRVLGHEKIYTFNLTPDTKTIVQHTPSGITTAPLTYFVDMNTDFALETIAYDWTSGIGTLYRHSTLPTIATISLKDETVYGQGVFGFDPLSCVGDITFKTAECDDSVTQCTYENSVSVERERLCTTCDGTTTLFCGNYSYGAPQITCPSMTVGEKTIQLIFQSESKENFTHTVATIPLTVSTDASCNTNILNAPSTEVVGEPTQTVGGGSSSLIISDEASDLERYYYEWLITLDESVPRPLQLIVSLVIISMFAIYMHRQTNGNNYMTIIGSLMGAGISVALGLLAIELVLIIGVGLLIFVFVAYKFEHRQ